MYYPIQIPYILNSEFSNSIIYREFEHKGCEDFSICFWEMAPKSCEESSVTNIIVADACIDIVVDYDNKQIGFAGMSKTDFEFKIDLPTRCFGIRLKPGSFYMLTGLDAKSAMDTYIDFKDIYTDFDLNCFFNLSFESAQKHLGDFMSERFSNVTTESLVNLFDTLYENTPETVGELCDMLKYSLRQTQRLFVKNFGITPKMALSIIRFQKCLEILTSTNAKPSDILNVSLYYDQPHFNNDFKKNLGITPLELINAYRR